MPSIAEINKKREAIEREKRKIAEKAAERATKEHEARLEAEADSLDWELEQVKASAKAQEEAIKRGDGTALKAAPSSDEIKRLVEAARAKAAGGTPPKAKVAPSGSTPATAAVKNDKE